jgi:hypothetical protein
MFKPPGWTGIIGDRVRIHRMSRHRHFGVLDNVETLCFIDNHKDFVNLAVMKKLFDMLDREGIIHTTEKILLPPHDDIKCEIRSRKKEGLYYLWVRIVG